MYTKSQTAVYRREVRYLGQQNTIRALQCVCKGNIPVSLFPLQRRAAGRGSDAGELLQGNTGFKLRTYKYEGVALHGSKKPVSERAEKKKQRKL